jgi:hypothetical protein
MLFSVFFNVFLLDAILKRSKIAESFLQTTVLRID